MYALGRDEVDVGNEAETGNKRGSVMVRLGPERDWEGDDCGQAEIQENIPSSWGLCRRSIGGWKNAGQKNTCVLVDTLRGSSPNCPAQRSKRSKTPVCSVAGLTHLLPDLIS